MDLFGRARGVFKRGPASAESAEPQYYRVSCPLGHPLRGVRTEGYQAIRCPNCGEGVFILPRSPLPMPPAPPKPKLEHASAPPPDIDDEPLSLSDAPPQDVAPDVDIPWQDEVEARAEPEQPPAHRELSPVDQAASRPARPRPAGPVKPSAPVPGPSRSPQTPVPTDPGRPRRRQAETPSEPAPVPGMIPVRERVGLGARMRRHRTLLVILGAMVVVSATFAVRAMRQRRQSLPGIAKESRADGMAALENAEFDLAKRKLAVAASALEELGDADASAVRQAAGEAELLADVTSASPEEILEEVAGREDGPSRFDSIHRGRAVIIGDRIREVRDGVPQSTMNVFAPGAVKPKRAVLDYTGFRLLSDRKKDDELTFGARLKSLTLDDSGVWHFTFEPDSGVYITTPEAWKALEKIDWKPVEFESSPGAAVPGIEGGPKP